MLLAPGAMAKNCENEEVKRVEKLDKALGKCGDDADCAEAKRQKCRDKLDKHGCDSSVCDPPSPCEDSIFPECGGECPPDEECGEVSAPFAPQLGLVAGTVCACVAAPPPPECAVDEDCANDTLCDEDMCVEGECQHSILGCPIHPCLESAVCVPETGECVEVPKDCGDGTCDPATGECLLPPPGESCEGRCDTFDPSLPCQCDPECTSLGDCCPDAYDVCDSSCEGHCGAFADVCHCEEDCAAFGDCCPDFDLLCGG